MKILRFFIFFFWLFSIPIGRVSAAGEFHTSFNSIYTIDRDASTSVTHNIAITNKLANIYLTKYTLSLGAESITSLRVTSGSTRLPATAVEENGHTIITINIPQPVIGLEQTLDLRVAYQTSSIAKKYQENWEINIPKVSLANEFASYQRTIMLPPGASSPSVALPRPSSSTSDESRITLTYLGFPSDNISLLIGDSLTYELLLTYFIENPTSSLVDTEIAIPPDTAYQRVLLDSIEPEPKYIRLDSDGNWLATYALAPNSNLTINTKQFVTVYPLPTLPDLNNHPPALTLGNKYWEVDAPAVKNLGNSLKTPENFYNYLVGNFTYDYDKLGSPNERLGAALAIENPESAICTEFTDSFVALARSQNIPAREINGISFTTDPQLLHAWPEYYDLNTNTWIQVDPTLGNTTGGLDYFRKLDFGHLAFVRHGIESDYPHAAGSYFRSEDVEQINLKLATIIPEPQQDYVITGQSPDFTLKNTGNVAMRQVNLALPDGSSFLVHYLPPRATLSINTDLSPSSPGFFNRLYQQFTSFFRQIYARLQS